MAIRKIGRDPEGIESLKLYASLTPQQALGTDLQDEARQDEFADRVRRAVSGSVQTPARLHGLRVEAPFRAMLVALGGFTLFTDVDGGEPYFDDAGGPVKLPDFSIVDRDGRQLLVEVKSVPPRRDPLKPHTISKTEMLGLQRYGQLMKAPVAVAHYWTAWNRWTLVGLERLTPMGKRYGIGLQEAFAANELSRFGDCLVGTRPPLTFVLNVEPMARPTTAGQVQVRVTGVEISAAGVVLDDEREANIAWFLMQFGDWPADDPQMRFEDDVPQAIEMSVSPPPENLELVEQQGFTGIGMLSSLYSSLYNEMTLTPDGRGAGASTRARSRGARSAHPGRLLGSQGPGAIALEVPYRAASERVAGEIGPAGLTSVDRCGLRRSADMNEIVEHSYWWVPGSPDARVHGALSFDPSDGASLTLLLRHEVARFEWTRGLEGWLMSIA